jgi:hypothetical protein
VRALKSLEASARWATMLRSGPIGVDGICITTGVKLQGPEGAQRLRALSA